ncbi:tape measure protein [Rhodococcus hoagii]|nr:tape measure protein [Prescottella equi]NKZ94884.1 tape measure protein [Prescottella equi]
MELGVGYLSIVADTRQMPGQLQKALDGGQAQADKAGQGMGSKIAGGLGKTLKVGVVGAGTAAAGVLAASITKGLGRLNAIEQAQAKLSGLGNSTQAVGQIMDNALVSVKGTAFGLGDAATVAASAVAAGVKPGKDLERTLKLTGDAATIAGVGMGEMGAIFNKVAASNKIQGDVIAQLNDQGIPIIQLLGAELGKTAEETVKLASDGKINFETFQNAMEKGLGGASLKAGGTAKGAFDNMNAALGRLGATLAGPAFRQAPAALGGITKWIDELDGKAKPVVAQFESDLKNKYLPALKNFGAGARDAFGEFRNSDLVQASISRLTGVFEQVSDTAREVGPAVGSIVTSLSQASAALGVSSWQLFLTTLEATAKIADATIVPVLNTVSSLMEDHPALVVAAVAAWGAFKTVPGIANTLNTAVSNISSTVTRARGSVSDFAGSVRDSMNWARQANPQMSTLGTGMTVLGANAKAAFGSMKTAASNAWAAMGGLGGVGIAAATTALVAQASSVASAESANRALADAVVQGKKAQGEFATAVGLANGALDDQAFAAANKSVESSLSWITELGERGHTSMETLGHAIDNVTGNVFGQNDAWEKDYDRVTAAVESNNALKDVLGDMSLEMSDLGRVVAEGGGQYDKLIGKLRDVGPEGERVADILEQQSEQFGNLSESMERIGPASTSVTSGLTEIAAAAGDGDKKLSGLKLALQGLGILETDAQSALFDAAEAVRDITEEAAKGVDPVNGFGESLLGLDGKLDPNKSNAKALRDSLTSLGDQFLTLRNSGVDTATAMGQLNPALESLANQYGLPLEKVRELARAFGLVPAEVDTILSVQGGDEAWRAITDLKLQMDQLPDDGKPKTVTMQVKDEDARAAIERLGFEVEVVNATTGEVKITARNDLALAALDRVKQAVAGLDISVADPTIGADTTAFRVEDQGVRNRLGEIDRSSVAPEIGALIDKFINGRDVTLAELSKIDLSTAEPDVQLLIQQAMSQAKVVNDAIDQAARRRTAEITVSLYESMSGTGTTGTPRAAVGQHYGADGGLYGVGNEGDSLYLARKFANGGLNRLPEEARIEPGRGAGLVQWAEGETGGEAFIPLAPGKRARSTAILADVAERFGLKLTAYADGGIRSLREFVDGRIGGASRPLTGAPYVWGGVNWGDCSGAMSAIARFAVGLAPFAARFATSTMAGALASMGFSRGRGGPGDLRFGWYNGGPYGGHTAGTLPDGTNVEMGGAYGGGMVGGSTGSNSPEFTDHAYLPIGGGFDWSDPGGYPSGGRGRVTKSGSRKRPEWTDKQQLDLENAEIEVRKAEEARTKVEAELAKGKKTQTDLDSANKKIELAQQKVVDLQKKKDDVASWVEDGPAPQAPALSRMFSDAEIERIDAQLAVDAANERRNEVYDDPDSTETELAKADAELFKAQKALREMGVSTGETASSWSELAGEVAKTAVSGYLSDTLGVLGIPDEIPPAMRAWQMFEKAQAEQNPYLLEPSADERAAGAQVTPIDPGMAPLSAILGDSPVLYDAQRGVAQLGDQIADGLNSVGGPASEAAVALRAEIEKFRGAGRYWNGGTVDGPPGIDQVPAWLTAKEIVLNTAAAAAGDNAAIAAAMNAGTKFLVGGQKPQRAQPDAGNDYGAADHSRCVHYHLYGIGDVDEALARIRTEEKVRGMTHGGSL